jgi:hypothetical protein
MSDHPAAAATEATVPIPDAQMITARTMTGPLPERIVVLIEPGRNGDAALARATALATALATELTVVATAPQTATHCRSCGGVSPRAYNRAVCEEVADSLRRAATRLGPGTGPIQLKLLIEGADPPLADWVAQSRVDLVLLPAHRSGLHLRTHPQAGRLRRTTAADVEVVSA